MDRDPDHADDAVGMEWWYVNFHVETGEGKQLSAFAAFFRVGTENVHGGVDHSHALAAAWCDAETGQYQQLTQLDDANLGVIRETLRNDRVYDGKLRQALHDMVSADQPPLPDLPLEGSARVSADPFALAYGPGAGFRRDDEGRYHLQLIHPVKPFAMDLAFEPLRPAAWQNGTGRVAGVGDDEGMRYYSVSRLDVTGEVTVDGSRHQVTNGTAWYDHEWGIAPIRTDEGFAAEEAEWDWCGLHLDNGWDISTATRRTVRISDGSRWIRERTSLVEAPDGSATTMDDHVFERGPLWTSMQTCNQYPLSWTLTSPTLDLSLTLRAAFARQEVRTITVHRGFWEGRVHVNGIFQGQAVTGVGFVEVKPAQALARIEQLMPPIAAETRRLIRHYYPAAPSAMASRGFLGPGTDELLPYLPHAEIYDALARPLLHLVDAMGKNWRPFAFIAALEVLGVDSDPYRPMMAVVELLHTASLAIDDIEDEALFRRGRPAAHTLFGTATVINAGTAAYFVFDRVLSDLDLEPAVRLYAYELYCGLLRSAHVGQALDLKGRTAALDRAVAEGDPGAVSGRVLAVHRLKTALPVRALAELGSALAQAGTVQRAALCDYFEALGLAYQISDDVFDIRGHGNGDGPSLKTPGEDIRNGRVTYPLACALELLSGDAARELWQRVAAKPLRASEVIACVDLLEKSGGVDLALRRARLLVDRQWAILEPLLPNYPIKAVLRALGLFAAYRDAELNG